MGMRFNNVPGLLVEHVKVIACHPLDVGSLQQELEERLQESTKFGVAYLHPCVVIVLNPLLLVAIDFVVVPPGEVLAELVVVVGHFVANWVPGGVEEDGCVHWLVLPLVLN